MIEKVPEFEDLWTGESVWCVCGHHVNMHTTKVLSNNDDYIDSICRYDNGHYMCPCIGFASDKVTTILTATNGQDKQEFQKVHSK